MKAVTGLFRLRVIPRRDRSKVRDDECVEVDASAGQHLLVGREEELDALRAAVAGSARSGTGSCHAITGPRGIGKTSLARALLADSLGDVDAVFVRCWTEDGAPPLWPWPDVLERLAALGHAQASLPVDGSRFDASEVIRQQLASLDRPVALVIDDVHAAAPDAQALIRLVASQIHDAPVTLVLTVRTDTDTSVDALLATVAASGSLISLNELRPDQVADLLHQLGSHADASLLHRRSGGNPLFLHHLARSADDHVVPPAIEAVVRPTIDELTSTERSIVEVLGVFGSAAPVRLLESLAMVDAASIDALVGDRPGLVLRETHVVRFAHEIVHDVVLDSTPHARRLEIHARCVDLLADAGRDFELRRVHHALAVSARSGDDAERAVSLARSVAGRLPTLAFQERADLLGRAIDVERTCLLRDASLVDRLAHADATLASGHLTDARELYREVALDARHVGNARLLARGALGLAGVWVEDERAPSQRQLMLDTCRTAVDLLDDAEGNDVLKAQLRVRLSAEAFYDGDHGADPRPHIETLRTLGDDKALAESLSLLHHTMLTPDHASDRLLVANEMVAAATRAGSDLQQVLGMCWRTVDLYLLGDPAAERALDDTRRRAETLGSASVSYMLHVIDVMRLARHGDLERAGVVAAEVFAEGEAVGDADALAYYAGQIAAIGWLQGTWGDMLDAVAEVAQSPTLREHDTIYPAMHAALLADHGRHDEARTVIATILERGLDNIARNGNWLSTICCLVEAARVLEDADLARGLLPRLLPLVELPAMPSLAVFCLGPVARYAASAAATAGDLELAIVNIERARAVNHRLQNLPCEALILADHADILRRRGRGDDWERARQFLGEAVERAGSLGLTERHAEWSAVLDELSDRVADSLPAATAARAASSLEHRPTATFARLDGSWLIRIDGDEVAVRHSIGLSYLAELLARPGIEIAAVDLAQVGASRYQSRHDVIDEDALVQYRQRLADIDAELDEIHGYGDVERSQTLTVERDAVLDEVKRSVGLHSRVRTLPSDAERARSSVSKAIRRSIERLAILHPSLGYELAATIKTGQYCSYQPSAAHHRHWRLTRDE